jgi:hypothetical protein
VKKVLFDVGKELCGECTLALRRFIGHMEGVDSIDIENGKVAVAFDNSKIAEKDLLRITTDSLEKLGYPPKNLGNCEE